MLIFQLCYHNIIYYFYLQVNFCALRRKARQTAPPPAPCLPPVPGAAGLPSHVRQQYSANRRAVRPVWVPRRKCSQIVYNSPPRRRAGTATAGPCGQNFFMLPLRAAAGDIAAGGIFIFPPAASPCPPRGFRPFFVRFPVRSRRDRVIPSGNGGRRHL